MRAVVLTAEGAQVAAQVSAARADRLAMLLERIPAAERPAVLAALETLVEAAGDG